MKWMTLFFVGITGIFCFAMATTDWIQPPLKTESGYLVPQPYVKPQLPRDLGAHPGYAVEWWYWVGHLKTVEDERTFGFQSTVFRLNGDPRQKKDFDYQTSSVEHQMSNLGHNSQSFKAPVQTSPFGKQQLFMAHVALSDLHSGIYLHAERIFREGWQAQASTETLNLNVGPIIARWNENKDQIEKKLALPDGRILEIKLKPVKPMVVFGERGLSRKGNDPSAVSWYWTYPRMEISGVLIEGKRKLKVTGIGWMDHEISSSPLSDDLVGWDWTAIQLDDGTEVKAYRLRTSEGSANPWSTIYWIDSTGETRHVYAKNFDWVENKMWKSTLSGKAYPSEVTIRAVHPETGDEKVYRLQPLLDAQEFIGNQSNTTYWEGTCAVYDANKKRIGKAYLELVGYGNKFPR